MTFQIEDIRSDIENGHAVIFIIDIQSEYFKPQHAGAELLDGLSRLRHAASGKAPVIHFYAEQENAKRIVTPTFIKRIGVKEVLSVLDVPETPFMYPMPESDFVAVKGHGSAFGPMCINRSNRLTTLEDFCEEQDWKTIVYAGIYGNLCVWASLYDGKEKFKNILISDLVRDGDETRKAETFSSLEKRHLYYEKEFGNNSGHGHMAHVVRLQPVLDVIQSVSRPAPNRNAKIRSNAKPLTALDA